MDGHDTRDPCGVLMIHGDEPLVLCCYELHDALEGGEIACKDGGLCRRDEGDVSRSCPFCGTRNILRYDAAGPDTISLGRDLIPFAQDLANLHDGLIDIRDEAEKKLRRIRELTSERCGDSPEAITWRCEDEALSGLNDMIWETGEWLDQIWDGLERMTREVRGNAPE